MNYVVLIHSSLNTLKEFKDIQMANRDQFLVNSFMTKPTISNLPGVMPPQDAMQRMEQLKHEYFSRENFHHALLEYWMTNSGMSQITVLYDLFRYTLKTCTFKLAIFIYRGSVIRCRKGVSIRHRKGVFISYRILRIFRKKGGYKVQPKFSERGCL